MLFFCLFVVSFTLAEMVAISVWHAALNSFCLAFNLCLFIISLSDSSCLCCLPPLAFHIFQMSSSPLCRLSSLLSLSFIPQMISKTKGVWQSQTKVETQFQEDLYMWCGFRWLKEEKYGLKHKTLNLKLNPSLPNLADKTAPTPQKVNWHKSNFPVL